jgi:hypothetical protein
MWNKCASVEEVQSAAIGAVPRAESFHMEQFSSPNHKPFRRHAQRFHVEQNRFVSPNGLQFMARECRT